MFRVGSVENVHLKASLFDIPPSLTALYSFSLSFFLSLSLSLFDFYYNFYSFFVFFFIFVLFIYLFTYLFAKSLLPNFSISEQVESFLFFFCFFVLFCFCFFFAGGWEFFSSLFLDPYLKSILTCHFDMPSAPKIYRRKLLQRKPLRFEGKIFITSTFYKSVSV